MIRWRKRVQPPVAFDRSKRAELHTLHRAFTEAGGHWSTFVIWAKQWHDAVCATSGNDDPRAAAMLQRAIETYEQGFRTDLRDYYPIVNAVTTAPQEISRSDSLTDAGAVVKSTMISRCARVAARFSKVKPKIRPMINPPAHFPRLAPSLSDGTFCKHCIAGVLAWLNRAAKGCRTSITGRTRRPDRIESPWKEDFSASISVFVMAKVESEKADKILSASLIRSLEVASTAN
jgi:hypothetical protein